MTQRDKGVRADYVDRAFKPHLSSVGNGPTPAQRAKERRRAARELEQVQNARPTKPPQRKAPDGE